MTQYASVPRDEYEMEESTETVNDNMRASKARVQVYEQVAGDDNNSLEKIRARTDGACVHPFVLMGLALLFTCFSLIVGILYHFSQANNGLTTEKESRRYFWIYGPTAVIVLIQVFWRVIDLKVKATMPWNELSRGPASADRTLLLEYFSHTIPSNIWRSIKNQHWAVVTTIVGHLLLLLMIVFATGLFALETVVVTKDNVLLKSNKLDGNAYNTSVVGASSAYLTFANLAQDLPYPEGTTNNTLVPVFESIIQQPDDYIHQAEVEGLEVSVDCERLEFQNATKASLPWWSIRAPFFLVNVSTPSCELQNIAIGRGPNSGIVHVENATQTYQSTMRNYVCNSGLDYSRPYRGSAFNISEYQDPTAFRHSLDRTVDDRVVISLVDFSFTPTRNTDIPTQWVNKITAFMCKPSYTLNQYHVSYGKNTTTSQIEYVGKSSTTLSNFYPADMSRAIYAAFNDNTNLYIGAGGVDRVFYEAVGSFFQMASLLHGGEKTNFTLKNLMDPDILKSSAEKLMMGTVTQLLHKNIMTNMSDSAHSTLIGTSSHAEKRLRVKALSTGFLCAGFGFMTIVCLVLIFILPQKPKINGDIGSTAIVTNVMRSNTELTALFQGSGARNMKLVLKPWDFISYQHTDREALVIDCVTPSIPEPSSSDPLSRNSTDKSSPLSWWEPASARSWYIALAVVISVTIIGLLEGLQHISDHEHGLVEVNSIAINSVVLAQYIPAAVALGINMLFGSIESIIATISPFATLQKNKSSASRTLALNYLTRTGPHVFVISLINRHLALTIILLTTFVASFLTIVIPGLYSKSIIPSVAMTTLLQADTFNPNGTNISLDDKRAGMMLELLTYYDIDYANWVYDDMAFPQLSMEAPLNAFSETNSSATTLSMRTKAMRANLSCESVSARTRWIAESSTAYTGFINVTGITTIPWSMCSNPPADTDVQVAVPWTQSFWAGNRTSTKNSYYIGRGGMLEWYRSRIDMVGGEYPKGSQISTANPVDITLPEWGCPSLAFTLGHISLNPSAQNSTSNSTRKVVYTVEADVATLICSQRIQSLETNLTLEYPAMAFPKDSPPKPDESTIEWLKNPADKNGGTNFQFAPNNMILSLNNPDGYLAEPWNQTDDVDRFMQAVVYVAENEHGLKLQDLVGAAHNNTLLKMTQQLYARYMAQALSNNMRVGMNTDMSNVTFTDLPWTATVPPSFLTPTAITKSYSSSKITPSSTAGASRSSRLSTSATTSSKTTSPSSSSLSSLATSSSPPPRKRQPLRPRAEHTIHATLTRTGNGAHTRLVQNRSPKIALQVMLGFMAAGAILAKLLLRTKDVLQHEPYSIAGRAMLVANGDLLAKENDIGKDQEAEMLYRLGWWKDEDGVRRYGIYVKR